MAKVNRRDVFIKALATFLTEGQAEKSIRLEMGDKNAQQWAVLRSASPLFGYPTAAEAERDLRAFLGLPANP